MQLKNTRAFLEQMTEMDMPVSNTSRGEQIQQTFRNNLTTQLKEVLFEDCMESFPFDDPSGIIAYRTKDGVVLELPNNSVADNITNEYGSGAISIEIKFTIKGLEYNAADMAEEYDIGLREKAAKAKEAERKKLAKIERDRKAREARELKRAKIIEAALREGI